MQHTSTDEITKQQIKQLNSFLRGELSAAETYSHALEKLASEPDTVQSVLEKNRSSHRHRARVLETEIKNLGGEPAESSGVWGAFAMAMEGGASLLGVSPTVAVLEEGEDHGLADYKRGRSSLTPRFRTLVDEQLLPEQKKTHDATRDLKKAL